MAGTQTGIAGIRIVIEEPGVAESLAIVGATGPDGEYDETGRSPQSSVVVYTLELPSGLVASTVQFDAQLDPANVAVFEANFEIGAGNVVTPVEVAAIPREPTPFPTATATSEAEPTATAIPVPTNTPAPVLTSTPNSIDPGPGEATPTATPTNVPSVTPLPTDAPDPTPTTVPLPPI